MWNERTAIANTPENRARYFFGPVLRANPTMMAGIVATWKASNIPSGDAPGARNIPINPPTNALMIPGIGPRTSGATPASTTASGQYPPPPGYGSSGTKDVTPTRAPYAAIHAIGVPKIYERPFGCVVIFLHSSVQWSFVLVLECIGCAEEH